MKNYFSVLLLAMSFNATAEDVAQVNPKLHSGGLAYNYNNVVFTPSKSVLPLPNKNLSRTDKNIVFNAEQLIDNNKTTALLLIEKGEIVFEKYKLPADINSPLFSQSMSKSLTAIAFGSVMCSGKIQSIEDRADSYAPELNGTIFGKSSIKNLLRMSSGTTEPTMAGSHDPKEWFKLRDGYATTVELLHGDVNVQDKPQGTYFRYSSTDTWSIAEVAAGVGMPIAETFDRDVWKKAGTESNGYWLQDKGGHLLAHAGFSATARDWARLAIYTIKSLKGENGKCIKSYMEESTSPQIKNESGRVGKAFKNYGYQTWIADFAGRKSYWWVGYGGQRVGIEPESERIIVLTSWREDYMGDVYKLFGNWTK